MQSWRDIMSIMFSCFPWAKDRNWTKAVLPGKEQNILLNVNDTFKSTRANLKFKQFYFPCLSTTNVYVPFSSDFYVAFKSTRMNNKFIQFHFPCLSTSSVYVPFSSGFYDTTKSTRVNKKFIQFHFPCLSTTSLCSVFFWLLWYIQINKNE